MKPITSIADILQRFQSGQCRKRAHTMAEVLGQFRKRDGRRAYFAVRHKQEQAQNAAEDRAFRARQGRLRFEGARKV